MKLAILITVIGLCSLTCFHDMLASISTKNYYRHLKQDAERIGLYHWQPGPVKKRKSLDSTDELKTLSYKEIGSFRIQEEWKPQVREILDQFPTKQQSFMLSIISGALTLQETASIPASATISMAIYESAYGDSELARYHHNYFGIKAFSDWKGAVTRMSTKDSGVWTKANFRAYPDFKAGVVDFANFLRTSDRYRSAFSAPNGEEFVRRVLQGGYCPDDDYHENVKKIIERYQLARLDRISI